MLVRREAIARAVKTPFQKKRKSASELFSVARSVAEPGAPAYEAATLNALSSRVSVSR